MSDFSAEEIKELTKVNRWVLRQCSICEAPLAYHIHPERERVAFDSSCYCTQNDGWRESSWSEIADHLNMQTNEEYRQKCLRELKGEAS